VTEGATGLSTTAIETMLAHGARDWHRPADLAAARAELAALVEAAGRATALAAALRGNLERHMGKHGCCPLCRSQDDEPHADWCAGFALGAFDADAEPGAAGARDETALLDAAARYRDAWRVLAAGDATEEAKRAHIPDMHEAREDLFDATEVALRAGGAGEGETGT
jgi:hypothetical protein